MYLKDSKTVVIKIGSSLLINDNKIIREKWLLEFAKDINCLLYTSPSPRDRIASRMPSSA